jgi:hypothetical protein
MNDFDEFLGRNSLRRLPPGAGVNHVFPDMILDHFGDEAVQGTAARSRLLKHISALIIRLHGAFDGFDLTAQSLDAIQQLGLLFGYVTHENSSR